MLTEIAAAAVRVNVIAGRYYKVQRRPLVSLKHLPGGSYLIAVAGAPVSDNRKSQFVFYRRTEYRGGLDERARGDRCQ